MSREFDAKAFRRALGNFTTGVTVITAQDAAGERAGITANSFNSVSLDPPLVLWSLDKGSRSFDVFESSNHFAVNVLASDQIEISNHFARSQEDKFSSVDWQTGEGGSPLLQDCAARFQCESFKCIDAGDHWIFLGKVVAFDDFGRAPLCYYRGAYSMVSAHPGLVRNEPQVVSPVPQKGRLNDSVFFLLQRAFHLYQNAYIPKQEALGMSSTEAGAIYLLSDNPELFKDGVPVLPTVPEAEIILILESLKDRGWIAPLGKGFALTDSGQSKAEQLWALSDRHDTSVFGDMSEEDAGAFKDLLRSAGKP